MFKRKLRNTKMRKTFSCSLSLTSSPIKKGKIKKNYKFFTKIGKKQAGHSSSSISLRMGNRYNPPFKQRIRFGGRKVRKQYRTKQKGRCRNNISLQKRKPISNQLLRTCFRNLSYTGSCESVDSGFSQSGLSNLFSDGNFKHCNGKKSKSTYEHSNMAMKECEHSRKCVDFSVLDGVTLTKTGVNNSTTAITFKSALMMHVRNTPAKTDVRSESQKESESEGTAMEVTQICDLLNEVNAGCVAPYKRHSSNLLKLALHNDRSKSMASLLRVKSSCNCTDLHSHMAIPQGVASSAPSSHSESRKMFPSQTMQHYVTDSFSKVEQKAQTSCYGDEKSVNSIMSNSQYTNMNPSTVPFSRSEISQLHHLQWLRSSKLFPSQNTSVQLVPSNKNIITRAMIHKEADD